ncbi:MAG: serine/threonine-protein kinase, partial [Myxococcota bacterium]
MASAANSDEPDLQGQVLDGRFELLRRLGMGGMGVVYEAKHVRLRRRVAVKVLKQEFSQKHVYRQRFLREARSAAIIDHRNVVEILDFGETATGAPYFAMEFLGGQDLREMLRGGKRLPWARARGLLLQAVAALKAAHKQGVIHRDIKPANCVVCEDPETGEETVKLLDFGIAKLGDAASEDTDLTGTGEVFGTAAYMAPEQAFSRPADARTDIYALAVMAYRMLTGRVPFEGVNAFDVLTRHQNEAPRSPRTLEPSIPEAVDALLRRALQKRPEDRFQTMGEVELALRAVPGVTPVGRMSAADTDPVQAGSGPSSGPGGSLQSAPMGADVSMRRFEAAISQPQVGATPITGPSNRAVAPPDDEDETRIAARPGFSAPLAGPAGTEPPPGRDDAVPTSVGPSGTEMLSGVHALPGAKVDDPTVVAVAPVEADRGGPRSYDGIVRSGPQVVPGAAASHGTVRGPTFAPEAEPTAPPARGAGWKVIALALAAAAALGLAWFVATLLLDEQRVAAGADDRDESAAAPAADRATD